MASSPVTSWQMDGETVETVAEVETVEDYFGGSKITAAMKLTDACSLKKKLWSNLDSILKSKDITLPTKVNLVNTMVFPVVMYECESWTVKKAEHWRIDAFELWCWRRLLRVPWTARRSNQSILKEISPEYSLEGLMLKLKLQYFGHLMQRIDSFEKTLMLRRIEGRRRRGQQRMRWLDGITQWVWVNSGSWWWTGKLGILLSMELKSWTRLSDSTELNSTDPEKSNNGVKSKHNRMFEYLMSQPINKINKSSLASFIKKYVLQKIRCLHHHLEAWRRSL